MGQTGIPYINKTGYSMFWDSMWDNKFNYGRNIREDIYLKKTFKFFFNDNMSFNYNKRVDINLKKYNFIKKKSVFKKGLLSVNKLDFYMSKLWILKYQKWVIIYSFLFIPKIDKVLDNQLYNNFYKFKNFNKIYNKNIKLSSLSYNFCKNFIF